MILGLLSMISTSAAAREVMDTRITELARMVWLSSAQMDMLGWSRHSTIRLGSVPISKHSSGRKSKCGLIISNVSLKREKDKQMSILQVNDCNSKQQNKIELGYPREEKSNMPPDLSFPSLADRRCICTVDKNPSWATPTR